MNVYTPLQHLKSPHVCLTSSFPTLRELLFLLDFCVPLSRSLDAKSSKVNSLHRPCQHKARVSEGEGQQPSLLSPLKEDASIAPLKKCVRIVPIFIMQDVEVSAVHFMTRLLDMAAVWFLWVNHDLHWLCWGLFSLAGPCCSNI